MVLWVDYYFDMAYCMQKAPNNIPVSNYAEYVAFSEAINGVF